MDEREPQQVKVLPDHPPKPEQPNHYGVLRRHRFGKFLLSINLTDPLPSLFFSIDSTENGRVELGKAGRAQTFSSLPQGPRAAALETI
jgi:hypothetical protein